MLIEEERQELERRVNALTTSKRDSERAEIILLRASGLGQEEVGRRLRCSSLKVSKWTARFRRDGLEGLRDKAGRGRKGSIPTDRIEQVITKVTQRPVSATKRKARGYRSTENLITMLYFVAGKLDIPSTRYH